MRMAALCIGNRVFLEIQAGYEAGANDLWSFGGVMSLRDRLDKLERVADGRYLTRIEAERSVRLVAAQVKMMDRLTAPDPYEVAEDSKQVKSVSEG